MESRHAVFALATLICAVCTYARSGKSHLDQWTRDLRFKPESAKTKGTFRLFHGIPSVDNDPSRQYLKKSVSIASNRIVGGVASAPGAYPFYAHSTGGFLCGGTFVHEDIILTAAHCEDTFVEDVFVGSNDVFGRDGAARIAIDQRRPHPNYDDVTQANDIMLVKLVSASSAPLVNWNINGDLPADGEEVKVIGFGLTANEGMLSMELLEVNVNVVNFDTCQGLLGTAVFDDLQICAGDLEGGKDSCQGDSGMLASIVQLPFRIQFCC
jgi:secreted trypsin-like serine protease